MPTLRPARDSDIPSITAIYSHYVLNTTTTFEMDAPDESEMARRYKEVLKAGLPYLVAESDGQVVGYAYAVPYRPRRAYRFTIEESIYLHPQHLRKGLGRLLMSALIEQCEALNYRQMLAVIGGSDNAASISLHTAMGFRHVGLLPSVGHKFGKWADSVIMQRALGPGDQ
jgi:phosphinothricin acetyltransferase